MADKPQAIKKSNIQVTSFPQGTNIFFTNPSSAGYNQAMLGILQSADEIQKFIDEKIDRSSESSSQGETPL